MSGGFVKLDTTIRLSSLWVERDLRSVFITSLVMAEPFHLTKPTREIAVRSLDHTGWEVPSGWYGHTHAASIGIILTDGVERELGMALLEKLCSPDPESRSQEFGGRRMARIEGGFLVLNYFRYRELDYRRREHAGADSYVYYARDDDVVKIGLSKNPWARMADLRVSRPQILLICTEPGGPDLERQRHQEFAADRVGGEWFRASGALESHMAAITTVATPVATVATPVATVATTKKTEVRGQKQKKTPLVGEADRFDEFWKLYPRRAGANPKRLASRAWEARRKEGASPDDVIAGAVRYAAFIRQTGKEHTEFVMRAATFLGPDKHFENPWTAPAAPRKPWEQPPPPARLATCPLCGAVGIQAVMWTSHFLKNHPRDDQPSFADNLDH